MIGLLLLTWSSTARSARVASPMATEWAQSTVIETGVVEEVRLVACSERSSLGCTLIVLDDVVMLKGAAALPIRLNGEPEVTERGQGLDLQAIRTGDTILAWGIIESSYMTALDVLSMDPLSRGIRMDTAALLRHSAWADGVKDWPEGAMNSWSDLLAAIRRQVASPPSAEPELK